MYSFGYTLLYSATSQHRIHAVIVALFLLIPTAADFLRGTILPWSYQAAHRTITSALVVLLCLTDVRCQAHVGSIHAGHMRWTHRLDRKKNPGQWSTMFVYSADGNFMLYS